jgi:drug/metabolite transporter (DMT)-like permease
VSADLIAVLWGGAAAVAWGAGDFSGGLGARRASSLAVTLISNPIGLVFLVSLAVLRGSPMPSPRDAGIAVLVGCVGAFGVFTFYQALATGKMGIAAPLTAVLATAVSVFIGALTEGVPGVWRWLGFAAALAGVWLISRPEGDQPRGFPRALLLAVVSGLAFGVFFSLNAQFTADVDVSWSLVIVRVTSTALFFGYAAWQRAVRFEPRVLGFAALAGVMDSLGNVLFTLAGQVGRLDISAVSSSLYPAVTVGLAVVLLRERFTPVQGAGALLALGAIALIVVT